MIQKTATPVPHEFDALMAGWQGRPGWLVLLGGAVLPLIAMLSELIFHLCRDFLFDPLPTPFHLVLVATVPTANLWVFLALRRYKLTKIKTLAGLNGFAIGASLFYSLLFLPLLPIGIIAIVVYGLGILILTPALALVAGLRLRRHLSRYESKSSRGLWIGFVCALGLLLAVEIPSTVTRLGMQM